MLKLILKQLQEHLVMTLLFGPLSLLLHLTLCLTLSAQSITSKQSSEATEQKYTLTQSQVDSWLTDRKNLQRCIKNESAAGDSLRLLTIKVQQVDSLYQAQIKSRQALVSSFNHFDSVQRVELVKVKRNNKTLKYLGGFLGATLITSLLINK